MRDVTWPTRADINEAVVAYNAGDDRPLRRIRRRAFWWGFTHPFARIPRRECPRGGAEQCEANWVPPKGGPGYGCALAAGHDGPHDPNRPDPTRRTK